MLHSVQQSRPDFWEEVAAACHYATFFHTPIWQDLTLATFPHFQDKTFGVTFSSGVRAVFPLLSVRHVGPLHDLHSSAMLCYGGPIADGYITQEELALLYKMARGGTTLRLQDTGNPYSSLRPPGYAGQPDYTHILELVGDFAAVYAGFSPSHKNHYRRGLRKGVNVRRATTIEDYRAYYAIYEDTLRRWADGDKPLAGWAEPWERFEQSFAFAQRHPEQVQLWVATVEEQIVSGALIFFWNDKAVYWHGATLETFFAYYPNIVLHTELIRVAVQAGYHYYDFNPSGGLAGVTEFKRRFGATQRPVARWIYGDEPFRLVRALRSTLAR